MTAASNDTAVAMEVKRILRAGSKNPVQLHGLRQARVIVAAVADAT